MIHRPASGNIVAAFLKERGKTRFLFRRVADRLRHNPRAAAPLFGDNLVHQLKRFSVDTGGNDGMLGHEKNVSLVYK